MDIEQRVKRVVSKGFNFRLEAYFSEGWKLFKKMPLELIIYTIITFVVYALLSFADYWGAILDAAASAILGVGYFIGFRKADSGEKVGIGDFFKSFDIFVQLFLLGVVVAALTLVATLFLILPGIWFLVATILAGLFAGLEQISFWDSIKLSIRVVNKKWFHFFALLLLLAILNFFGALALGVGLLITVPLTYGVIYACYKDIVGPNLEDGMNAADHLVGDSF